MAHQYLNQLDNWRDDIIQYNSLKSEYQTALVSEQLQKQEKIYMSEFKKLRTLEIKTVEEKKEKEVLSGI